MEFTHTIHRDYPRNHEGKNQLLELHHSLCFFHCIIQNVYNTIYGFYQTPKPQFQIWNQKTMVRKPKPWAANRLSENRQKIIKLHAKNITHNQHSSTCCFLCMQRNKLFQINNPGKKCPLLLYTKRTSQCSQILSMNLQHYPKC